MPGLDPGIHAMLPRTIILRVGPLHVLMDPRVKPGGDSGVCGAKPRNKKTPAALPRPALSLTPVYS